MATKKAASKSAAKAAAPAKKGPAKPAAAKATAAKTSKTAAPKAAAKNAVAPKAAATKAAPPKTTAQAAKKAPAPAPAKVTKAAPKATAPEPQKAVPEKKKAETAAPKAAKPDTAKAAAPEQKVVVAAPTQEEVKPAIKPLAKHAPKKEASKPFVIPKTTTNKAVKYEPEFTKSVLDTQNQEPSGPTMRYSDAELQEFRDLINRKLNTAKKELAYLQGLITRKDESGDLDEGRYMTMEDGSMSMEREQLSQMASRQIQFIDHLEKAIMRIENKTYGVCRVTGKLIDKARLRAVPHATLSIEAKQMMNK